MYDWMDKIAPTLELIDEATRLRVLYLIVRAILSIMPSKCFV